MKNVILVLWMSIDCCKSSSNKPTWKLLHLAADCLQNELTFSRKELRALIILVNVVSFSVHLKHQLIRIFIECPSENMRHFLCIQSSQSQAECRWGLVYQNLHKESIVNYRWFSGWQFWNLSRVSVVMARLTSKNKNKQFYTIFVCIGLHWLYISVSGSDFRNWPIWSHRSY
jgi:hypothetical protein